MSKTFKKPPFLVVVGDNTAIACDDRKLNPAHEWVIWETPHGDGGRREYITHAITPRFVARIVSVDDDGLPEPEELPADLILGTVCQVDEQNVLCEIDWIDMVPASEAKKLIKAAAGAVERHYGALEDKQETERIA